MNRGIFIAACASIFFHSCRKDVGSVTNMGYNYSPVQIGSYVEYQVWEVVHDDALALHDTAQYYLKELVESEFIDNEGRPSLRLERYRKDSMSYPWVLTDIWYSTRTNFRLERVEEDKRVISMIFPVKEGEVWNGNALNNFDEWDYSYRVVDSTAIINGLLFDSVAVVVEHDFRPGFFFHEYSEAIYARGVGLVQKRQRLVEIDGQDIPSSVVQKGNELFQQVIGYGLE